MTSTSELTGYSGTYVQTGFGPPNVQIPMFRVVTNEIRIRAGWRYGEGD